MARLDIQNDVSLADLTTFKVGGPARYLVTVTSVDQLTMALEWAAKHEQKILIVAGGSNLIVSSAGFPGLVIKLTIGGQKIIGQKLEAGAAVTMKELVDSSIAAGLSGLEWAGGLPGTFGGAIRGNAGAFAGEIKDSIFSVTSVDQSTGEVITRDRANCQFGYRDSLFKHQREVVIGATLWLKRGDQSQLRQIADSRIQYRHDKHPMEYPNSGSIFKNVPVDNLPQKVKTFFQESIKTDPFPVVPAAKVIAETGLKGLTVGGAQISQKHTNYIINTGQATGEDIFELIKKIQAAVKKKYQIELEVEPELVGFW